ncbi:hypothetical protein CDAR_48711 [Caerostris darwini]|uniref:Uncharacterized protein n=1 Tax=Caerostris darwini TaxID=1538125 RepID=A0AAV4NL90_9ARAC|nr:hypothetical protein CDAR_48711 [Caerostris darwini]
MLLAKHSQKTSSSTPYNDASSAKNFEVSSPPSACTIPWNIKNYVVCEGPIARGCRWDFINIQTNVGKWKEKSTYYSMNVSCNLVGEMMPYLCLRALSDLIMPKMLSGSSHCSLG